MRIRWTVEARNDLVRLHRFLVGVNPSAAARAIQTLRATPARMLLDSPRIGFRLSEFDPREVRRLLAGDYEIRYEIRDDTIMIVGLWHTREDR